jgi:sugar phosphate isomerase/epimerase
MPAGQLLSVQLYSLRELCEKDRDEALRRVAGFGYTAVEPFRPAEDPTGFRALADELGLSVPSVHAGGLIREAERDAMLEATAVLGAGLAVLPAGIPPEDFASAEGLDRAAGLLNTLSEQARSHGIRIGYHNHWWEFENRVPGPDGEPRFGLEALADRLDPEVALEVDTYWAAVGGADDVPALLGRLGDRVAALHVKDGPMVKGEPHTALGAGRMPIPEILAAAPPDALRVVELDDCAGGLDGMLAAVEESVRYFA